MQQEEEQKQEQELPTTNWQLATANSRLSADTGISRTRAQAQGNCCVDRTHKKLPSSHTLRNQKTQKYRKKIGNAIKRQQATDSCFCFAFSSQLLGRSIIKKKKVTMVLGRTKKWPENGHFRWLNSFSPDPQHMRYYSVLCDQLVRIILKTKSKLNNCCRRPKSRVH